MARYSVSRAHTSRSYAIFLTGQAMSGVGSWCYRTALPYMLLRAGASGFEVGAAVGAGTFSLLLLTPYASAVADRRDNTLFSCATANVGLAAIFMGFYVGYRIWGANIGFVIAVCLIAGAISAFEAPFRQRFLPLLVGQEAWSNAIIATGLIYNVSRLAGPVLAIGLLAVAGSGVCLLANALSFFVAAASLVIIGWRTRRPPSLSRHPVKLSRAQTKSGWTAAMRVCLRNREFAVVTGCIFVVSLLAVNEQATVPLLSNDLYPGSATYLALLLAAVAVGALAAGLLLLRYPLLKERPHALSGTIALLAAGNILVCLGRGHASLLVVCAILGLGIGAFTSVSNVLIQQAAPFEYRARVFATFYLLMFGTTAVGAPMSGELADMAGPRAPFYLAAIACLSAGGFALLDIRRRRRSDPAVEASVDHLRGAGKNKSHI